MAGLNFENIGDKFLEVTNTKEWAQLQEKFNDCVDIFVLGHGGNLGVADHAAVDISRLSNGTKNAQAPGSGIVATSLINDSSFDDWMVHWVRQRTVSSTPEQLKKTMILGISSSGKSVDIIKALEDGKSRGMQVGIITSYPIPAKVESLPLEPAWFEAGPAAPPPPTVMVKFPGVNSNADPCNGLGPQPDILIPPAPPPPVAQPVAPAPPAITR